MSDEHSEYRSTKAVSGEFYFAASIGHVTYIKVVATSLDDALHAAEMKVIDDFENAGPLMLGDVILESLAIDDEGQLLDGSTIVASHVELSIIAKGAGDYEEVVITDEDDD